MPSRISARPISWLSSVMRIALQRPSIPIISAVTPGSANQPPSVCAVSGVSSHGQCSIIVEGQSSRTRATSDCTTPTASSAVRTCGGSGGSPGSGVPGSVAAIAPPGQRDEHRRGHVEADPDPERDVLRLEAVEVQERPDRHEQRERRDRQEADLDAMPHPLARDAQEEVGAGDVTRAHHQRRDRGLDVPGEVARRCRPGRSTGARRRRAGRERSPSRGFECSGRPDRRA